VLRSWIINLASARGNTRLCITSSTHSTRPQERVFTTIDNHIPREEETMSQVLLILARAPLRCERYCALILSSASIPHLRRHGFPPSLPDKVSQKYSSYASLLIRDVFSLTRALSPSPRGTRTSRHRRYPSAARAADPSPPCFDVPPSLNSDPHQIARSRRAEVRQTLPGNPGQEPPSWP
jgi:hypothetical protein